MKQVLTNYPDIQSFSNVNIDFTEESDGSYGLSSVGDKKLSEDILGNQKRINNMELYAVSQSIEDCERLQNSSFLIDLGYYLETIKGHEITAEIGSQTFSGHIEKIETSNGMAWSRSDDGQCLTYQIQIKVIYTLESEE